MSNLNNIHETSYETLKLLNYIVHNDMICTSHLSSILKNDKSERSNLRHFKTIQEFFKNEIGIEVFERTSRGCYRIINKQTLMQALNLGDKKELLSYIQILKEVVPHYYDKVDPQTKSRIEKAKKASDLVYLFHNNPIEDFANHELLKRIEKSIGDHRKSSLTYRQIEYKDIKPLKIVFMEGNLYLACLTNDEINSGFKFLRINLISDYTIDQHEFHETEKVLEARQFLTEFQTPFTSFQADYNRVLIDATEDIARYFIQKKHLPSQTEQIQSDGSLRLTYYVTDYMEISTLVKKWLPKLKLIEPIEWRNRLNEEIESYLESSKNDK